MKKSLGGAKPGAQGTLHNPGNNVNPKSYPGNGKAQKGE